MDIDLTLPFLLALLGLLVLVLAPLLWRPVLAVLQQREALISGTTTATAALRQAASSADTAYARQLLTARQAARAAREQQLVSGRAAARTQVAAARTQVAQEMARARAGLAQQAQTATTELQVGVEPMAQSLVAQLLHRQRRAS